MIPRRFMGIAIILSALIFWASFFFVMANIVDRLGIEPQRPPLAIGLLFPLSIFFFGVLIGLIILWYYYPEIRPNRMRKKGELPETMSPLDVVLFVSNDDETKVIEAISRLEGGAYQFEIAHLADLNKMKVHRVVKRLLDRGILRDEYFDENQRNRKLFLADWVGKTA